jgi:hypothetical protein
VVAFRGEGWEVVVPYSEETIREAFDLLAEEAPIEGDGRVRALRQSSGAAGCVVTPLSIKTAAPLLALAFGGRGDSLFVSGTRGLCRRVLRLVPCEDSPRFAIRQERGKAGKRFDGCAVAGFELRVVRGEAVKLKLDIAGDVPPAAYPVLEAAQASGIGERFREDGVTYSVDGVERRDVYGVTVQAGKEGGTKTEVRIHRVLRSDGDFPSVIENLVITAWLRRNQYEDRQRGRFSVSLSRLLLMADETVVDASDAVVGPLRFFVSGAAEAEVFAEGGEGHEVL